MLTAELFRAYVGGLKLPTSGIEYLERVRADGSSRRVQSGALNVTVRFPSLKMGRIRQAESRTIELPTALSFEYDDDVFEYYDQPEALKLVYTSSAGRKTGVMHTPDFLVLGKAEVSIVECKPEDKLVELAVSMPNRYQRGVSGNWICPPGEAAARELGFAYKVVSSATINDVITRNIIFLSDYLADGAPESDAAVEGQIVQAIRRKPGITLKELFAELPSLNADQIFTVLASGRIHFDIGAVPLVDRDRVQLFETTEAAAAYKILAPSLVNSEASPLKDAQMKLFSEASREDWSVALDRFKHLKAAEGSGKNGLPLRTLQRYRSFYQEAETSYGCGLFGLLPRFKNRGNRTVKLPGEILEAADLVIEDNYLTLVQKSVLAVYGTFLLSCKAKGLTAPSYQWFCERVAALDAYRKTKLREGNRAAIPLEPRPPASIAPRTCDRPFERAHIDHTLLDIELISEKGHSLGRPWLTLMIDEFSRRILAFYITFNPPSATSALAVLRLCVSRFGRLPDCITVDGGRDFSSEDFEILTARYIVRIEKRPPARARFGSVIERMFGTINTQLIYQLVGNTQATKKNVRTVTKGNDPKGQAVWTQADLEALLERYLFEIYDKANHSSLDDSPANVFARGIEQGGLRPTRKIDYEEFAMWTFPSAPRGKVKVQPRRGVLVHYTYYWCEEFKNPTVENTRVDVRYDPFDLGVAYAWVNKKWVKCISSHHHILKGRSLKELRFAAEELRRTKSRTGRAKLVTAKALAELMATVEPTGEQRKQQLKDEAKKEAQALTKETEAESDPSPSLLQPVPPSVDADDIPDAGDL